MSLENDIKAFQQKALLAASTKINSVVDIYFRKVVELSPNEEVGEYSKGTIKDNWFASTGKPATDYRGTHDSVGASSLMRVYSLIETSPFLLRDNKIYLSNSTPWAYRAEYLGWPIGKDPNSDWHWSNNVQPYAMVRGATTYMQSKI